MASRAVQKPATGWVWPTAHRLPPLSHTLGGKCLRWNIGETIIRPGPAVQPRAVLGRRALGSREACLWLRHIRWPSGHQRQRSRHRSDVAGRLCGSQPGGAQPGLASEQVDGDCRATEKPEPTCPGQSPSRRPSSRTPLPAWGTASGW
ncbi:uncharacterized protein LOC144581975 isoform X2 [Callithrix jacchus]